MNRLSVLSTHLCVGTLSPPLPSFQLVQISQVGRVGMILLNRPTFLNALSPELISDLVNALEYFENKGSDIGCIVISGNGKAFAAGADIKTMANKTYADFSKHDLLKSWEAIAACRIPLIAAVNGIAFGGGCELSMMCDVIYASEDAKFGQPEITLGIIPGAGGTQRLVHAIGKSKAMELILSGQSISAHDAEKAGLVSKVFPKDQLMPEALKLAEKIASMSRPVLIAAKQSVNTAFETSLKAGCDFERRVFHSCFALEDQKIGMQAFLHKSKPQFTHR